MQNLNVHYLAVIVDQHQALRDLERQKVRDAAVQERLDLLEGTKLTDQLKSWLQGTFSLQRLVTRKQETESIFR